MAISLRFIVACSVLSGVFPGVGVGVATAGNRPPKAELFPLEAVKLLPGVFRDDLENDRKYLRSLKVDRLLHNFRVNAGLPSKALPLGGWESPGVELRGHFTGHFMSACALAYASTHDELLKRRAMEIVAGLAKCQQALGRSGYLSAFPETFFDRLESGKQVWAPWYTIHKIGAGLLDVYLSCDDTLALNVLTRKVEWVKQRISHLDDAQMQQMLAVEHGGMGELLRNLYDVTRNPEHLALARRFDHGSFLAPLREQRDALGGFHANTNIPKVIGAAREYEVSGDRTARDEAMFFWNDIVHKRSFVTGGTSNYEYWRGKQPNMADELSAESHENCCTYNMLKLTEHVFCWTADPGAADYFERALFNGILPTQKPGDGSGIMYYVPMRSGLFKMFGDPDSSFWCCTGTGIESFAKLQHGIYFHDSTGVFVNLYIASELVWKERGLTLRQETAFPEEEGSTIVIKLAPREKLSLYIRIPYWVAPNAPSVELNGAKVDLETHPSSYVTINRVWAAGDRVSLHLPMHLHLESPAGDSSLAAVLYGPVVLAGELGTRGMTEEMKRGFETPEVDRALFDTAPIPAPTMVVPASDVSTWLKPVRGRPLEFRTVHAGKPTDVTLIPFYRLFGQRYALYWNLSGEINWEILKPINETLPASMVDLVQIGDKASEKGHDFQAFRIDTGSTSGYRWVQSAEWFRYDMRVDSSGNDTLACQFVGDAKDCVFDLLIDGMHLASDSIRAGSEGVPVDRSYAIPAERASGREQVAVKFKSRDGRPTPRLCRMSVRGGLRN